jgi:ceramide glucosyltransferase
MTTLTSFLLASAALAICVHLGGVLSALLHLRRRNVALPSRELPPISLLKPVKGLEEDLEACLRSFFEQDYAGPLELVFASGSRDDPALVVARRIAADYPEVRARFVLSDENWGFNPKVSNLQGALSAASHDLVLQTDANVWAPRDYVRKIVTELLHEDASLLSSLVTGIGEQSPGAAMENLQLSAYVAPACCTALKVAGVPCVIGKSMLFRKSELKQLGGLELVKDSLAEDFLLGRHYAESGKKVVLSATPIRNVNVDMPIDRSLGRHARWLKMRAVIHVPAFIADFFCNPVALSLLAWLSSGCDGALLAVMCSIVLGKMAVDGLMVRLIRGTPMRLEHLLWAPVKDVLMFGVWTYAIFSRSIEWRGIRFRMGPDSQLMPDRGALPVRLLRRVLGS